MGRRGSWLLLLVRQLVQCVIASLWQLVQVLREHVALRSGIDHLSRDLAAQVVHPNFSQRG